MDQQQKKRYSISVLGCRTNQYEAQAMKDQLEALGYVQAQDGEEADISIVNTCTVTEGADSSSRHAIRSLAKKSPQGRLVVTGCLAEREPERLYGIQGVHKVVSNSKKEELVQDLFPEEKVPEFSIKNFEAHTRAFVKVQDGCNSFCTYCIIPYVRGRSKSRSVSSILEEISSLIATGYKEVVITGINVGDFDGGDEKARLADLVQSVDAIPGLERLRISSIDPDEVDDTLLEAIMNGKTTCHSMHIVLQSGSNTILKRMNRKYTKQIFLETIRRLRSFDPDFTFTTDVIVGFPGETEEDFLETLEVIERVQFSKVHMFPYSSRPRTRAALYKDKIAYETIQERKQRLIQKAEYASFLLRGEYVGRVMEILTEQRRGENQQEISGHTRNFLPVILFDPEQRFKENQAIHVLITENRADSLFGIQV
ncbi:MAG: tRNA (N(6)-L-threonylcarbamoyladenosine(37)-C(2))-methylthiotransferase MtaB [Chlamydia sp.]